MRIRIATPFVALLALTLFPACTNVRDLGEGNSRYGMEQMNLDLDAVLMGQVGSFRDVNHPAEVMAYNETYGDQKASYVQLDVYDDNRWAMAGLNFEGVNLDDIEVGETRTFAEMRSFDNDMDAQEVNVYGIGCSSVSDGGYDEPFAEVEVTALEDDGEKVIDFTGTFPNGEELSGTFPANSETTNDMYYGEG